MFAAVVAICPIFVDPGMNCTRIGDTRGPYSTRDECLGRTRELAEEIAANPWLRNAFLVRHGPYVMLGTCDRIEPRGMS